VPPENVRYRRKPPGVGGELQPLGHGGISDGMAAKLARWAARDGAPEADE
jgi:hypothetical protein